MNNKIFTLFIAALLISNASFAKIFRLGYTGPQVAGTDFADGQSAHDAASAGDTLLFFPGNYSLTAGKKLVYIGTGYFTEGENANPNLQLIKSSVLFTCWLTANASGSVFEGIESLTAYAQPEENVNDIIIRKCKGGGAYVRTGSISNNWHFLQCFNMQIGGGGEGDFTNLRVENSKISLSLDTKNFTGQFLNCFFENLILDLNDNTLNFQNCIFSHYLYQSPSKFTNSVFQNCLFNIADPGLSGSNNKFGIEFFDTGIGYTNYVFTGWPVKVPGETADGKYKLKAGSPAKGAGMGGVDMGMFGGANPYKLSGIPSIPAFYKLTAPSNNATTNPYTITFSVRSNN